jgi:hypothetical protein
VLQAAKKYRYHNRHKLKIRKVRLRITRDSIQIRTNQTVGASRGVDSFQNKVWPVLGPLVYQSLSSVVTGVATTLHSAQIPLGKDKYGNYYLL